MLGGSVTGHDGRNHISRKDDGMHRPPRVPRVGDGVMLLVPASLAGARAVVDSRGVSVRGDTLLPVPPVLSRPG